MKQLAILLMLGLFVVGIANATIIYDFTFDSNSTSQPNNAPFGDGGIITGSAEWIDTGYVGGGLHSFGNSTANPSSEGLRIVSGSSNLSNTSFSVELWFNESGASGSTGLFGIVDGGSCETDILSNQGGSKFRFLAFNPTNGSVYDETPTQTYTPNQWNYLALTYNGVVARAWLNGVNFWNLTASGNHLCFDPPTDIIFGSGGSGGISSFNGTVDNLKIRNDIQTDLYYQNLGITPPTTPVPTIILPANTTYTTANRSLQVTANESVSSWWYILNGGSNTSFTPNTTILATNGTNTLTVYVNGTSGSVQFDSVTFTVTIPITGTLPTIVALIPILLMLGLLYIQVRDLENLTSKELVKIFITVLIGIVFAGILVSL